ncbi:MAG TPA: Wzz/FepE/Etk N-terminal domain-containing protein, partial [Bacteroidia bacterium]|nr:Wzz/FepE/Etk N-terminal domain-containing protein [Bacteroidia bacterium]
MLQAQLNDKSDSLERYKERLTNFSGEFDLGLFVFIAKKSVLWVILFLGMAIGGSWLYLRYAQPEYESTAILQINNDNNAKMLNVSGMYDMEDQNELASAIEVIRSKVFLRRVLSKLPLEVSYFAEGKIKTNEHYKSSPYTVGINLKSQDLIGTRFDIKFNNELTGGEVSYSYGGQNFSQKFTKNKWLEFPQISFLITFNNEKLKSMLHSTGDNNYYFV